MPSADSTHKSPVALQWPSTAQEAQRREAVFATQTRPVSGSAAFPVQVLQSSASGLGQSSLPAHDFVHTPPLSGPSGRQIPSMHSRWAMHFSPYLRSAIIHGAPFSSTHAPERQTNPSLQSYCETHSHAPLSLHEELHDMPEIAAKETNKQNRVYFFIVAILMNKSRSACVRCGTKKIAEIR